METLFIAGLGNYEIWLIITGTLFFILLLMAVIDVLNSDNKDVITKLLWILFIICFPIIGALGYLIFGRSKKPLTINK